MTLPYREDVLHRLQTALPGKRLFDLAGHHGITVAKNGRVNKGWVGLTIERIAELANSNLARPDGEDFELKTTRLDKTDAGWSPAETIKVTQLNPQNILEEEFETSTLWKKLERLIIVGCHYASPTECEAVLISAVDVDDPEIRNAMQAYWEDVRHTVSEGEIGRYNNLGTYEDYLQLRPTGNGKLWSVCPITGEKYPARAFYATKRFIRKVLAI